MHHSQDLEISGACAWHSAAQATQCCAPNLSVHSRTSHLTRAQIVPHPGHFCRLAHLPPLRCVGATPAPGAMLRLGVPEAPVGIVSFAFVYVMGVSQLLSELPQEGRAALSWLQVGG